MDILYGLVGAFVIAWLLGMVITNKWVAAGVGYVATVIILGLMPAGIVPMTFVSALVGAGLATLVMKPKSVK